MLNEDEINQIIKNAIREHEYRIGLISGILGSLILFSIYYWLMILSQRGTNLC
jgi:hypothetical protein